MLWKVIGFQIGNEGASSKGSDKCRESDDGSHEVRSRPGSSVEVRAERPRPAPPPTSRPVTRRNAGLWEAATKIFAQICEIGPTVGMLEQNCGIHPPSSKLLSNYFYLNDQLYSPLECIIDLKQVEYKTPV